MAVELVDLGGDEGGREHATEFGDRDGGRGGPVSGERFGESVFRSGAGGIVRGEEGEGIAGAEFGIAVELGLDGLWGGRVAGDGGLGFATGRDFDFGRRAGVEDEVFRGEGGDFGGTEFFEEGEEIVVGGTAPGVLEGAEEAAGEAGGEGSGFGGGGGEEGEHAEVAPGAEDADGIRFGLGGAEGVCGGEDFLDFVTGEVAAEFEGGAVEPFAGGEVAGGVVAGDEGGGEDAAMAGGEIRDEGEEGFVIGIAEEDDIGGGIGGGWEEVSGARDVGEGGPADRAGYSRGDGIG